MSVGTGVLGVLATLTWAPLLSAHVPQAAPDTVSVADATDPGTVSLARALTLGENGPGVGPLGRVAVGPDSAVFAVVGVFNPEAVNLYSATGEHLATVGGGGEGPGEFGNVRTLASLADSFFVYDTGNLRESVFDFGGALHRERRIPPRTVRALPHPGGRLVVNTIDPDPRGQGAPLHVLGEDGERLASFPDAGGRYGADEAPLMRRALATAGDSTVWAAPPTAYRIERWTLSGRLVQVVERQAEWFTPHRQTRVHRPGVEPPPRVWDLFRDEGGRLWVLIHVADERWSAQFRDDPDLPPDMRYTGNDEAYWDSVVEVLDPVEGRVVARGRWDRHFAGFTTAGHLASYRESAAGFPYIDIWEVGIR